MAVAAMTNMRVIVARANLRKRDMCALTKNIHPKSTQPASYLTDCTATIGQMADLELREVPQNQGCHGI